MDVKPGERRGVRKAGIVHVEGNQAGRENAIGIARCQNNHTGNAAAARVYGRYFILRTHLAHQHSHLGALQLTANHTSRVDRRVHIVIEARGIGEHSVHRIQAGGIRGCREALADQRAPARGVVHRCGPATNGGADGHRTVFARNSLVNMHAGECDLPRILVTRVEIGGGGNYLAAAIADDVQQDSSHAGGGQPGDCRHLVRRRKNRAECDGLGGLRNQAHGHRNP